MKKRKLLLIMAVLFMTLSNENVLYAEEKNKCLDDFDSIVEIIQEDDELSLFSREQLQKNGEMQARVGYKVVTKSGNLNVRSGPGTNYSIIGKLAKGSVVDVSIFAGESGYWWEITARDSYTGKFLHGWVDSRYLEYIPGSGT